MVVTLIIISEFKFNSIDYYSSFNNSCLIITVKLGLIMYFTFVIFVKYFHKNKKKTTITNNSQIKENICEHLFN